jgi:1,4-alpha-glucan branching enzyme
MIELARGRPAAAGIESRLLTQAARELLLAQSSDWAFIATTGTSVGYAAQRFRSHVKRFLRLDAMLSGADLDLPYLEELERRDTIFQELDYRVFA